MNVETRTAGRGCRPHTPRRFARSALSAILVAALALSSEASADEPEADDEGASASLPAWLPDTDLGSFYMVNKGINAFDMWSRSGAADGDEGGKYTGAGIGVALIDSGVAPVAGLDAPGKVLHGPDLSFESQIPGLRNVDTYGHGTHLAGIIAGRDQSVQPGSENNSQHFVGVAPGAHIVSLKVAANDGAADVSQVIAAIDWVVGHHDDPGLAIRVLNLSFGTTALQSYDIDPLAHAVENAWHHGIVVVVAAGNDGASGTVLTNPAIDPYVIAVGASDHAGTETFEDDSVATFSSVGNSDRGVDLVAPGRSIVSLRVPGSWIDEQHPTARVSSGGSQRFFRGSGTSQAAAVVAGAVALILDERPELTPDQVKHLLTTNARPLGGALGAGAGSLDLKDIHVLDAGPADAQSHRRAIGTGSLELARGGSHVIDPATGHPLVGEIDIFGTPWDAAATARRRVDLTAWVEGAYHGTVWSGSGWSTSSLTGKTWRSTDWSRPDWTGKTWRDSSWNGKTWRGSSWSGKTWRDSSWTGKTWREATWSGRSWG